jgi:hypothetical protein
MVTGLAHVGGALSHVTWHGGPVPVSYYKGERLGKASPCAICAGPGKGSRAELHLPYGVSVWLCAFHRTGEFATRRSGRDLAVSLMHVWGAAGCLTRRRHKALASLLGTAQTRGPRRPGSYAWPELRLEAERRFAAGEARTPRGTGSRSAPETCQAAPTLPAHDPALVQRRPVAAAPAPPGRAILAGTARPRADRATGSRYPASNDVGENGARRDTVGAGRPPPGGLAPGCPP